MRIGSQLYHIRSAGKGGRRWGFPDLHRGLQETDLRLRAALVSDKLAGSRGRISR